MSINAEEEKKTRQLQIRFHNPRALRQSSMHEMLLWLLA